MLETRFDNSQLAYNQKSEWVLTDFAYGSTTTSDTPAQGYFVRGSHIPAGRMLAVPPQDRGVTGTSDRGAILPDLDGLDLVNDDGSDYSINIADALDDEGNFIFIGISCMFRGEHDLCDRVNRAENNRRNGMPALPNALLTAQPKPLGYEDLQSIDNYYEYGSTVSAVNNDIIGVYVETDVDVGDKLYVRVKVDDPVALVDQLIGGFSTIDDTVSAGATQDPSKYFNLRVVKPAKAGSAALVQIV